MWRLLLATYGILPSCLYGAPRAKLATYNFVDDCEEAASLSLLQTRIYTYTGMSKLVHHSKVSAQHRSWKPQAETSTVLIDRLNCEVQHSLKIAPHVHDLSDVEQSISRVKRCPNSQPSGNNYREDIETRDSRVRRRLSQVSIAHSPVHVRVRGHGATLSNWASQTTPGHVLPQLVQLANSEYAELTRRSIVWMICVASVLILFILAPLGLWLSRDTSQNDLSIASPSLEPRFQSVASSNPQQRERRQPEAPRKSLARFFSAREQDSDGSSDDERRQPKAPRKSLTRFFSAREQDSDGSSDEGLVGSDKVKRTCYVCMADSITTASLPCRHSSMCAPCMEQMLQVSGRCPLCRSIIDTWVEGDFDADFIDLPARVVASTADRICEVRAVAFAGMYDHIRSLVLIGLLEAISSVFFLSRMKTITFGLNLGTIFAGLAFLTGYLPWFSVTVAAFEREERDDTSREALFSGADCARPHILLVKLLLIVALAPLALFAFFLPYMLLVVVLRPFEKYALPWLGRALLYVILDVCFFSFVYVFRPCYVASQWISEISFRALKACLILIWSRVIVPIGIAIWNTGIAIVNSIVWARRALYSYVLLPCGTAIGNFLVGTAKTLYSYVLVPFWNGGCAIGSATYDYVLSPLGCGLAALGCGIYDYILTPLGHCFAALCRGLYQFAVLLATGVTKAATFMYQYGVLPVGRAVGACISALPGCVEAVTNAVERGLAVTLDALYAYIVVPVGTCIEAVSTVVYVCIAAVVDAFCAYVWCPICSCISTVVTALYKYVLCPLAKCIIAAFIAIAKCVAAAAIALYIYVLAPVGAAIWAVCAAIASFIWSLSAAIGSTIWAISSAMASACSAAGQWIAETVREVGSSLGL